MRATTLALGAILLFIFAAPAIAHHAVSGLARGSFEQALLSGIGHPLLGLNHLIFVLAMGAAAAFAGVLVAGSLAAIAAMLLACFLTGLPIGLPVQEMLVGFAIVSLCVIVASQRRLSRLLLAGLFAGFGLLYGAGFGATIVALGGDAAIEAFAGYLLGLCVTQTVLALGSGLVARRLRAAPTTA